MAIQSEIYLAKGIRLDRDYNNVLNYTPQQMLTYVQSKQTAHAGNYSFVRDGSISVAFQYSTCLESNYIAFQNKNYSNRWFFAWIDEIRYVSDGTTEIKYTIDSWSTFFSSLNTSGGCYIIREHTNDDTIGTNTIDEGLAIPEVEQINIMETNEIDQAMYICVSTNWDPSIISSNHPTSDNPSDPNAVTDSDGEGYNGMSMFNKNTFGSMLCLFTFDDTGLNNLQRFLLATNRQGHIEDVHDMFIIPACIFTNQTDLLNKNWWFYYYRIASRPIVEFNIQYKVVSYMSSNRDRIFSYNVDYLPVYNYDAEYHVKNNKLFCFPYNYLMVTNNIGQQNIYKLEEFTDVEGFQSNHKILQVQMSLSIGMSGRIVPVNYKGRHFDFDECVQLAKFPTCSWSADSYTNWLTQQSVNSSNPALSLGADIVAGGSIIGGLIASAATEIATFYGGYKKAQLLPEITGGQATGDVNFGNHNNHFTLVQYRIKLQHLKQIDDYFSRYGYKTLRVKAPNITGRQNWNYIQIGSTESIGFGDIPEKDLNNINRACRKGVTIWHNHANIGNFNLTNNIVS